MGTLDLFAKYAQCKIWKDFHIIPYEAIVRRRILPQDFGRDVCFRTAGFIIRLHENSMGSHIVCLLSAEKGST